MNINLINVGDIVHRFFDFHRRFKSKVVAIDTSGISKFRCNDGDQEILTQDKCTMHKTQAAM